MKKSIISLFLLLFVFDSSAMLSRVVRKPKRRVPIGVPYPGC